MELKVQGKEEKRVFFCKSLVMCFGSLLSKTKAQVQSNRNEMAI